MAIHAFNSSGESTMLLPSAAFMCFSLWTPMTNSGPEKLQPGSVQGMCSSATCLSYFSWRLKSLLQTWQNHSLIVPSFLPCPGSHLLPRDPTRARFQAAPSSSVEALALPPFQPLSSQLLSQPPACRALQPRAWRPSLLPPWLCQPSRRWLASSCCAFLQSPHSSSSSSRPSSSLLLLAGAPQSCPSAVCLGEAQSPSPSPQPSSAGRFCDRCGCAPVSPLAPPLTCGCWCGLLLRSGSCCAGRGGGGGGGAGATAAGGTVGDVGGEEGGGG
mmetsp:Transcript_78274/g.247368  ORF Transcript_78274/g.247368 Transcript_78274/m.247368 type:complete len:272 (+) Transcript_78274:1194-2009(+)